MDIVKMLRSYVNRENISAMDKYLMSEAADIIERYETEEEQRKAMTERIERSRNNVFKR